MYTNQPTPIAHLRSLVPYQDIEAIRTILCRSSIVAWRIEARKRWRSLKLVDALYRFGLFKPPHISLPIRQSNENDCLKVLSVYSVGDVETTVGYNERTRIPFSVLGAVAFHNTYGELLCKAHALATGAHIVNQCSYNVQHPVYEQGKLIGSEAVYIVGGTVVKIRSFTPVGTSSSPLLASSVELGVTIADEHTGSSFRTLRTKYYFGNRETAWLIRAQRLPCHWGNN